MKFTATPRINGLIYILDTETNNLIAKKAPCGKLKPKKFKSTTAAARYIVALEKASKQPETGV